MANFHRDQFAQQGEPWFDDFVWEGADGTGIDFTGCTAKMQVRPRIGDEEVLYEFTTENGGIILGPAGAVHMEAAPVETIAWTRSGAYDLFVIMSNGTPVRLVEGAFDVSLAVTQL